MIEQTQDSSRPSLDIAIMGLGGIGSAFAFRIAKAGHEVTAIARPESFRLEQLKIEGGIVAVNGERVDVQVTDALDEHMIYDVVIVTLPAHQLGSVLPALKRSAAKCVLFMANNFDPERLQREIGSERCAFGMPFIQAFLAPGGKLNSQVGNQKTKLSDQRWVDLFIAAELPAVLEPDMLLWLRCHVPLCIAFESISVAAVRRGSGASWAEAMVLARGVKGGFALIKALGYRIYPGEKAVMDNSPTGVTAAMLWTLSRNRSFRELLATGVGECLALVDELAAAASRENSDIAIGAIIAMKPNN